MSWQRCDQRGDGVHLTRGQCHVGGGSGALRGARKGKVQLGPQVLRSCHCPLLKPGRCTAYKCTLQGITSWPSDGNCLLLPSGKPRHCCLLMWAPDSKCSDAHDEGAPNQCTTLSSPHRLDNQGPQPGPHFGMLKTPAKLCHWNTAAPSDRMCHRQCLVNALMLLLQAV